MTATNLYHIILVFLIVSFIVDKILEYLNAKCLTDTPPQELCDIYEPNE